MVKSDNVMVNHINSANIIGSYRNNFKYKYENKVFWIIHSISSKLFLLAVVLTE